MCQPTVYLVIGQSAIAFDESYEVIETVEWDDHGKPLWVDSTICDHRGAGGPEGYEALTNALELAESVALWTGFNIQLVQSP